MDRWKRKLFQVLVALGYNGYFNGFAQGKIYRGSSKILCVPGLNCYSCPGALGSCPLGALQAVISDITYNFSFYVVGFLALMGIALGRFVCGWLCPFGLLQELLHRIPSPKIKMHKSFKFLKYLKYLVLIVFVFLLPMFWVNPVGLGDPAFCKFICPAGTLEGGIPLVWMNPTLGKATGILFQWKLFILIITVISSIVVFRAFCRFVCPLGAIYSLFNPISAYRIEWNEDHCLHCKACEKKCDLNIPLLNNPNNPECIRCGQCVEACPTQALKTKFSVK